MLQVGPLLAVYPVVSYVSESTLTNQMEGILRRTLHFLILATLTASISPGTESVRFLLADKGAL